MIISVASGKGGTGKTTVATSLACSLVDKVVLLDCDVEEPNSHLLVDGTLIASEPVYTMVPEIDKTRCSGCGSCADICRFGALAVVSGQVLKFVDLCHGCGGCMRVCPERAVLQGKRELGTLETWNGGRVNVFNGRLRVGEPAAPPLIREVRNKAKVVENAIIDAPPGTSCPAVAAIRETDFVLLVTEPTPFGLHDLQLAVEVVRGLGLPAGLVVNRANIGDRKVYEFAETENLKILMEIPFSRELAEVLSTGTLLIDYQPVWRELFQEMFEYIGEQQERVGGDQG